VLLGQKVEDEIEPVGHRMSYPVSGGNYQYLHFFSGPISFCTNCLYKRLGQSLSLLIAAGGAHAIYESFYGVLFIFFMK